MQGTMAEAAAAMAGRVVSGDPGARWEGGALDSRQVDGGELFFALPGEQADGHRFVAAALRRGAAGAVVHDEVEEIPDGAALIRVEDTFAALHDLTRSLRERAPRRLVAVTGSVGKTLTKEILAVLLGRVCRVAKSRGNLNNLYGFPLALMLIADDADWMVAEMGMSTPGELGGVSRLGRPDAAVFTNVRPVHLEQIGGMEQVAAAKAEVLEGLAVDGLVVANGDDPWVLRIVASHAGPVVRFGRGEGVDYRAVEVEPRGPGRIGSRFRFLTPGGETTIELPLHGDYNVDNFLAAAATAHRLGVPLEEIAAAASELAPASGRGVIRELAAGVTVVDDSYNSNPVALRQALESAAALAADRRHWAVLGEMLELGPAAAAYHREAGRIAASLGFSPVVGVGELARELVATAVAEGATTAWFATAEEAATWSRSRADAGDLILVKGSRGVALETVVAAMVEEAG